MPFTLQTLFSVRRMFRAARSLCMNSLLARYSIPRATSQQYVTNIMGTVGGSSSPGLWGNMVCSGVGATCVHAGQSSPHDVVCVHAGQSSPHGVVCVHAGESSPHGVVCVHAGQSSPHGVVCVHAGQSSPHDVVCVHAGQSSPHGVVCVHAGQSSPRDVVCVHAGQSTLLLWSDGLEVLAQIPCLGQLQYNHNLIREEGKEGCEIGWACAE